MGHGFTAWPNGDATLGFGWWLTARDLVKLGELYRTGGLHQGIRLLDEDWIRRAWRNESHSGNTDLFAGVPGSGYGYQWWITAFTDSRGRIVRCAYADGWGRQYVFVCPDLALTVVSTADDYDYTGPGMGTAMRNLILPGYDPILDARFAGSWYDPETSGQGLSIDILEATNAVLLYWFTFDDEGHQRWMNAQGSIDGDSAELEIYITTGGRFLQPDPVVRERIGTGRLAFDSCDTGRLDFEIAGDDRSYRLQRLTGRCGSSLLPDISNGITTRRTSEKRAIPLERMQVP